MASLDHLAGKPSAQPQMEAVMVVGRKRFASSSTFTHWRMALTILVPLPKRPGTRAPGMRFTPVASAPLSLASLKPPGVDAPSSERCQTPTKPAEAENTFLESPAPAALGLPQYILNDWVASLPET